MDQNNTLTPDELLVELRRFIGNEEGFEDLKRGREISSLKTAYYIRFEGQTFSLRVDTTADAVFRFVRIADHLGSATKALKLVRNKNGIHVLRVNDGKAKADGWYCYLVTRDGGSRGTAA